MADDYIRLSVHPNDIKSLEKAEQKLKELGDAGAELARDLKLADEGLDDFVGELKKLGAASGSFSKISRDIAQITAETRDLTLVTEVFDGWKNDMKDLSYAMGAVAKDSKAMTDISDAKGYLTVMSEINKEVEERARLEVKIAGLGGAGAEKYEDELAILRKLRIENEKYQADLDKQQKRQIVSDWDTDVPTVDRYSVKALEDAKENLREMKQEMKELGTAGKVLATQFREVEEATKRAQGGVPTAKLKDLRKSIDLIKQEANAWEELGRIQRRAQMDNRAFDRASELAIMKQQEAEARKIADAHRQAWIENKKFDRKAELAIMKAQEVAAKKIADAHRQAWIENKKLDRKAELAIMKKQEIAAKKIADAYKQARLDNKAFDTKVNVRADDIRSEGLSTEAVKKYRKELNLLQKEISEGLGSGKSTAELNKLIKRYDLLSRRVRLSGKELQGFNKHAKIQHGILRGLAGGVGKLWLSYGQGAAAITAMGAAYSVAYAAQRTFAAGWSVGSEFEYLTKYTEVLNEQSGQTSISLGKVREELLGISNVAQSVDDLAVSMREFSRAGIDTAISLEAVEEAAQLAYVGDIGIDRATKLIIRAKNAYKESGITYAETANVIAKASFSSATNMEEFATALGYTAPLGKVVGLSLEQTAAAVAALSDASVAGSKAGTSLTTGLLKLYAPSIKVKELFAELNLEFQAFHADGTPKDIGIMMGDLAKSMQTLSKKDFIRVAKEAFGLRALKGGGILLREFVDALDSGSGKYQNLVKDLQEVRAEGTFLSEVMADLGETSKTSLDKLQKAFKDSLAGAFMENSDELIEFLNNITDTLNSTEFQEAMKNTAQLAGDLASLAVGFVVTMSELGTAGAVDLGDDNPLRAMMREKRALSEGFEFLADESKTAEENQLEYNKAVKEFLFLMDGGIPKGFSDDVPFMLEGGSDIPNIKAEKIKIEFDVVTSGTEDAIKSSNDIIKKLKEIRDEVESPEIKKSAIQLIMESDKLLTEDVIKVVNKSTRAIQAKNTAAKVSLDIERDRAKYAIQDPFMKSALKRDPTDFDFMTDEVIKNITKSTKAIEARNAASKVSLDIEMNRAKYAIKDPFMLKQEMEATAGLAWLNSKVVESVNESTKAINARNTASLISLDIEKNRAKYAIMDPFMKEARKDTDGLDPEVYANIQKEIDKINHDAIYAGLTEWGKKLADIEKRVIKFSEKYELSLDHKSVEDFSELLKRKLIEEGIREIQRETDTLNFSSVTKELLASADASDKVEAGLREMRKEAEGYLLSMGKSFDSSYGKSYFQALVRESGLFSDALAGINEEIRDLNRTMEDTKFDFASDIFGEYNKLRGGDDKATFKNQKRQISELKAMAFEAGLAGESGHERRVELLNKAYNIAKSMKAELDTSGLSDSMNDAEESMNRAEEALDSYGDKAGRLTGLRRLDYLRAQDQYLDAKGKFDKAESEYIKAERSGVDKNLQSQKIGEMEALQSEIMKAQKERKTALEEERDQINVMWEGVKTATDAASASAEAYGEIWDPISGKVLASTEAIIGSLHKVRDAQEEAAGYTQKNDGTYTNQAADDMNKLITATKNAKGEVVKLSNSQRQHAEEVSQAYEKIGGVYHQKIENVPAVEIRMEVDDSINSILSEVVEESKSVGAEIEDAFTIAEEAADDYSSVIDDNISIVKEFASTAVTEINKVILAQKELNTEASKYNPSGAIDGARALGGPVSAGSTYLVGEKGPELFTPSASGYIIPNDGAKSSDSSTTDLNITIGGETMPTLRDVPKASVDEFMGELSRKKRLAA